MQPYALISLACAAVCAFGAFRKNRNPAIWGLLGAVFPLTVLIVAFLPFLCPECRTSLTNAQWRKRNCPVCGDLSSAHAPAQQHEDETHLSVEERAQAVRDALGTKDAVQVEWATNELTYLPAATAESIACEHGLKYAPSTGSDKPQRTKVQQRRLEEEAMSRFLRATKAEARGRIDQALAEYQEIIGTYPETEACRYAQISFEALKKKIG